MANCYINTTIEVKISSETLSVEVSGDEARTEGNTLRFDAVDNNTKRIWQIGANYHTEAEFNSIYNYLKSVNFGIVSFWMDIFGGTAATSSINAKISDFSAERVYFNGDSKGRNISFRASEQ